MESLHIVRPIAAPAREVVEHVRASFAAGRGEVSLVDVSGRTFALALRTSPSTNHAVWTSIIVRDTADGCVLVGRYRGTRGVSNAWIPVGIAWLSALLVGAPPLFTTLGVILLFAALFIRRSGVRKMGDAEAFATMCAALDGVLMPLPLASPYRAALASSPDEIPGLPIVQSHTRAEVTKVWALPPCAPVAALPAAFDMPAPAPQDMVDASETPPLVRIGDSLRCCIDVAAEPAAVHARLCAAFPEDADASTAAARTKDVTPTGFVLVRTTTDPRYVVASVYVELVPLADGTRIKVRWSRFRTQEASWLVYVGACALGLQQLGLNPLFGVLVLLSLAMLIWFLHFRRGRRAAAEFDLLAQQLQVTLVSFPLRHDLLRPEADEDVGRG